jgi:hypothetical protein
MRQFYLQWENLQTLSVVSAAGISPKISHMPSAKLSLGDVPLFSPIDGPNTSGNLVVDRSDNSSPRCWNSPERSLSNGRGHLSDQAVLQPLGLDLYKLADFRE